MPTTITVTFGADTKNLKKSLDDLPEDVKKALNKATTHTKTFSDTFSNLFKRDPPGERRGALALSRLSEGLTQVTESGGGAVRAVTSFGHALSTGIVGGAAIGAVGALAQRFVEAREEALKTEQAIHAIVAESKKTGGFESLGELRSGFDAAIKKAQELYEQIAKFSKGGALSAIAAHQEAIARGYRSPVIPGTGPSAGQQLINDLTKDYNDLLKAASDTITKMAQKEREANAIEEIRYRTGQRAAEIAAEEVKHKETLNLIEKAAAATGVQKSAEAAAENERHAQTVQRIQEQAATEERRFQAQLKQGRLSQIQALDEAKIADLQISSLDAEEKALAIARERSDLAQDRIESAKSEVAAAQDELAAAKLISVEETRRAQLRLQSAQTAEAQARSSAKGAAAGVADERAKAIQKGAAERRMTPEEQRKQYDERQLEFQSTVQELAHRGLRGDLAEPPKFGEAEYDPLRKFKAAAAQEELGRQRQREAEMATPEGRQRAGAQQARENPLLGHIQSDVSRIVELMMSSRQPGQPPPTGPQAPSGQPAIVPGQPQPQVGGATNPSPWSAGKMPAALGQANTTPVTGIRPETLQDLGITPESYANTDWNKVQEIQNNADAQKAYFTDPTVQAGFQGQAEIGRQAAEEAAGMRARYNMFRGGLKGDEQPPKPEPTPSDKNMWRWEQFRRSMKGGEGHAEESGGHAATLAAKAITSIPPELLKITGKASIGATIGAELINPETAYAPPLSSAQQKEAFEGSINTLTQKGDPESLALAKRLQADPEYARAKSEVEKGGSGGGHGENREIANAVRQGITEVMDKYWR